MEDDFLVNYLIVYIEKEIAEKNTIDMIIGWRIKIGIVSNLLPYTKVIIYL
jgi:hypothetical protein